MNRPPIAVEVAVREAVGAISGVKVTDVLSMPLTASGSGGVRHHYHVTVHGWSPSLHLHCMDWKAAIRVDQPEDIVMAAVLQAFSRHIAIQRARRDEGIALGTATPFGTDNLKSVVQVGHLLIDEALAGLLVEASNRPLEDIVAQSVSDLHRNDLGNGLETGIYSDDRIEGRTFSSLVRFAPGVHYDGITVTIPIGLPDTIRAAAIGRRIGDLVELPACLAERMVKGFEDEGEYTYIHIETRNVPIADICSDT